MRIIKYNKRNQTGSVTYQSVEVQQVALQVTSLSNQLNDWFTMDDNGVLVSNYSLASTSLVSSNYIIEQLADIKIYDSKIEYLQSTGTQHIDTGIIANSSTEINLEASFLGTGNAYQVLVGAADNSKYSFVCVYNKSTKKCYLQYGTTGSLYIDKALTDGVRYDFNFVAEDKRATLTIDTTRGVLTTTNTFSDKNIQLFANHNGNNGANARIYNISITDGANVLFNAIPVRVGTTGYMYDTVSGELFGNAGTGEFILGSDIV